MRDLIRSLTLMLILAVVFAGLLGACSGGREDRSEIASRTPGPPPAAAPAVYEIDRVPPATEAAVELSTPEPALVGPRPHDGDDHGRLGRQAFGSGDYPLARDHLRASLEEDQSRTMDRYMLGLALIRTGEGAGAVEQLSRVVMESPDLERPRTNLVRALLLSGAAEEARTAARETVDRFPDFADAHQVLGRSYLELDRYEDAEDAFRAAVAIDPDHGWAWNNLGFSLIQQGRFDEAVEPLQHSVELRPGLAMAHNNLGVALERTGDLPGAREQFRAAVDCGDTNRAVVSLARVEALLPEEDVTEVAAGDESGEADQDTDGSTAGAEVQG